MESRPDIESLQRLYAALGPTEKADLLEELLVAASQGEDEVNVVLNAWIIDHSIRSDIRMLPTTEHQVVLGIDAAWTTSEGSGVALFRKKDTGDWSCCALAPSYSSFLGLADGHAVQWDAAGRFSDAGVDLDTLLPAAEKIAGMRPTVVTVDMPLATVPIERRRKADDDISAAFGAMGCGAHTPNPTRPGPLAERMRSVFEGTGYSLAHVATAPGTANKLIEVYPHPALLVLLNEAYRIPYKVAKSGRLWRGANVSQRKANLLHSFARILDRLRDEVAHIPLSLPDPEAVPSLAHLKRFEDALDALVCAWVGVKYLEGKASPYGDETAAVWVPGQW